MIVNEREYRATLREIERFEQSLAQLEATAPQRDPLEQGALVDALRSDLEELRRQVRVFEQLRAGEIRRLDATSLEDLAELMVGARSALGLTQKELAECVGIKPQQVQRYEATRYAGVSIERLQAVAEAMELELRCALILPELRVKEDCTNGADALPPVPDDGLDKLLTREAGSAPRAFTDAEIREAVDLDRAGAWRAKHA